MGRDISAGLPPAIETFKSIGVSNSLEILERDPRLINALQPAAFRSRKIALETLGFKNFNQIVRTHPSILRLSVENNVIPTLAHLKKIGFRDPVKMAQIEPDILGYRTETIDEKMAILIDLGFKNPTKLIEAAPGVVTLDLKNGLRTKIEDYRKVGFTNPVRTFEKSPKVISLSVAQNIIPKIDGLRAAGFQNPIRILEFNPNILNLKLDETILPKIAELSSLGFKNPVRMIEIFPTLLSYSLADNLRPTIDHLETNWGFDKTYIEANPVILGASLSRISELAHWLTSMGLEPSTISAKARRKALQSLSAEQVQGHLQSRGYDKPWSDGAKAYLNDPANWKAIFLFCGEYLDPAIQREP